MGNIGDVTRRRRQAPNTPVRLRTTRANVRWLSIAAVLFCGTVALSKSVPETSAIMSVPKSQGSDSAKSTAAVAVAPSSVQSEQGETEQGTLQSEGKSSTLEAAFHVLENAEKAERDAVREAVEDDTPSSARSEDTRGQDAAGVDGGQGPSFRSLSELYQWAVKQSTKGGNNAEGDGFNKGHSDAHPEGNNDASLNGGQGIESTGTTGDDVGHSHTSAAGTKRPATFDGETIGAPPLIVDNATLSEDETASPGRGNRARTLEELERMADELPEFEGEIVVLERAVNALRDGSDATHDDRAESSVLEALETIADLCHSGDNGLDLHTLGGLELVVQFLDHPLASPQIHQESAKALSTCVQNNPPVAEVAVSELGVVPALLAHACEREKPPSTRARALMALAALVDLPAARAEMSGNDGHVEKVTVAITTALTAAIEPDSQSKPAGKDKHRGALRALALAEGVVRGQGEASAESDVVRWRDRLREAGVVDITRQLVETDHGLGGDITEAAARLATVMEI